MNYAKRERETLGFIPYQGKGSVEETFYPWNLTINRFQQEGLPAELAKNTLFYKVPEDDSFEEQKKLFFIVDGCEGVKEYEHSLTFDPIIRLGFHLPFARKPQLIMEDTAAHTLLQNVRGQLVKLDKASGLRKELRYPVEHTKDWEALKTYGKQQLERFFTDEILQETFTPFADGHDHGNYSLRLSIEGFFWVPRELMGAEPHLYSFYDEPELVHDMCRSIMEVYSTKLLKVIDILKPDVLYIQEDLSGKNGPMISPEFFDEFIGSYYKQLIPLLKKHGAGFVFVDTDGDFNALIPNFLESGVEGFLPMDVNAGMDIVKVRKQYPQLRFLGGYNKLCIADGREAIDKEFARIMPVIAGGGYIPGSDHQVPPSASLENYMYYIKRLHEAMEQACTTP